MVDFERHGLVETRVLSVSLGGARILRLDLKYGLDELALLTVNRTEGIPLVRLRGRLTLAHWLTHMLLVHTMVHFVVGLAIHLGINFLGGPLAGSLLQSLVGPLVRWLLY